MKRVGVYLAVAAAASVSAYAVAADYKSGMNGTGCQPEDNTTAANISRTQYGVQNNSTTTSATVWCPIQPTVPALWASYKLYSSLIAYDRHSSLDVQCTFFELYSTGDTYWSVGGLATTGSSLSPQQLVFNDTSYTNFGTDLAWRCTLPPQQSGSFPSHVANVVASAAD